SGMVKDLRLVRDQLESRGRALEGSEPAKPLCEGGRKLVEKLTALEEKLHNPRAKVVYDILAQKGGATLYSRMIFLYDNAVAAAGAPTQGLREVLADQLAELDRLEAEWKKLLAEDLAALNAKAVDLKVPHIVVPTKPSASL